MKAMSRSARIISHSSVNTIKEDPMIYQIVVPQFCKMLENLLAILDKAAAHAEDKKFEMDVLLQARLSPDQLNLIFHRQRRRRAASPGYRADLGGT
jgi:hypothetical protein